MEDDFHEALTVAREAFAGLRDKVSRWGPILYRKTPATPKGMHLMYGEKRLFTQNLSGFA